MQRKKSGDNCILKFLKSHSLHLFPCSPTDGMARMFYFCNTLEHHFNMSGFSSFSLLLCPRRRKHHLSRQFFAGCRPQGSNLASSVASKCTIHYTMAPPAIHFSAIFFLNMGSNCYNIIKANFPLF